MSYNTAAIRELLQSVFNDEGFTIFCYDYFRPAHTQFSVGMSYPAKVQALIEYCETQAKSDTLLTLVKEKNPHQYENFLPRLKTSTQATPPPIAQSPSAPKPKGKRTPEEIRAQREAFMAARVAKAAGTVAPAAKTETPAPAPKLESQDSKPDTLTITKPFKMEFIRIPAGEFLMGSDPAKDKNAQENEQPQHTVTLPDYYIAKYPVTNAQYAAFLRATGHGANEKWFRKKLETSLFPTELQFPQGGKNHPAVNISWLDAVAFCRWLTQESDYTIRLPTEAEWEKAARGTDGRIYPWGDTFDKYNLNCREGGPDQTTPVGQYSPDGDSPYGVADMAGNVWEWCSTIWYERSYPFQVRDEWMETYLNRTNVLQALRGGSWSNVSNYVRCSVRDWNNPDLRDVSISSIGFRLISPI